MPDALMLLVAQAADVVAEDAGAEVSTAVSNPLRLLGLARIATGGWIAAAGVMTLLQYKDFVPQAARLFGGDLGTTDAPVRSLLTLITAATLIPIGFVLVAKGLRWTRRLQLRPEGPVPLARDEVMATLIKREPPAFGAGPVRPYWLLQRWLPNQLADLTWWHRDVMSSSVQSFVRSCALALVLGVAFLLRPMLTYDNWLGPFPTSFVVMLIFVTAIGASLGLMLISTNGPRIESLEFPLPQPADNRRTTAHDEVIESPPEMLERDPPGLGLTLGFVGGAVQLLLPTWWTLSTIGFPWIGTSIIRHAGTIAGGILFFAVGNRMVTNAADLLLHVRYTSMLVFTENTEQGTVAHTAAVRTDSRGLSGQRNIIAAVVASDVREKAQQLLSS